MKFSKKLVACIAVMMMACMMLSACGKSPVNSVVTAKDGQADGEIGTTFRTAFFEYSVDSVAYPSEYEGYTPAAGMQLLDVVITIKNTFGEELPMYNSDFQIQWHDLGNGEEDYGFGIEMDSSSTIMPSALLRETAAPTISFMKYLPRLRNFLFPTWSFSLTTPREMYFSHISRNKKV